MSTRKRYTRYAILTLATSLASLALIAGGDRSVNDTATSPDIMTIPATRPDVVVTTPSTTPPVIYHDHATIGANEVPSNLHCQEDEVIGFDSTQPAPYPLACIHPDAYNEAP